MQFILNSERLGMKSVNALSQLNSITALRRSPPPATDFMPRQHDQFNAGGIFMPPARSFWGLGKSTERGTKQRAGKTVTLLNRWGRKAQRLSGWRLIPDSGQEIDQERHGQRFCLTVTAHANAGILARDVEYLLRPRELSFLKAFPSRSLR